MQSVSGEFVLLPTGPDVFRLFQAYIAVKDSKYSGAKVIITISIKLRQWKSVIFLVFVLAAALIVAAGVLDI